MSKCTEYREEITCPICGTEKENSWDIILRNGSVHCILTSCDECNATLQVKLHVKENNGTYDARYTTSVSNHLSKLG
jgi:uncharacterized Zn finger protein